MSQAKPSTITLRALSGAPLADARVRDTIVATAHAIAERQGVSVMNVDAADDRVTVTLGAGQLEALGFAAELRRLTSNWYKQKFSAATLWGDEPHDAAP